MKTPSAALRWFSAITLTVGLSACGGADNATPVAGADGTRVGAGNGTGASVGALPIGTVLPAPGSESEPRVFELVLTNATAGQPLSPGVVAIHQAGVAMFRIGEPASVGLEQLAEGAQTDPLLVELQGSALVLATATTPDGPIAPGQFRRLRLVSLGDDDLYLSLASMLVNTNDALAAVDALPIGSLAIGESLLVDLASYDSGTEANSETAQSIPGPVANGEGFNPIRDDIRDAVHGHPGVVSSDDGLENCVLTGIHRWNDPPARLVVLRME